MISPRSRAAQEWREGWTLVLAASIGFSFLTVQTGSMAMFIGPLGDEFGWSRTFISSGFTFATIFTALLSPFFGMLVDRFGSRRLALPGIVTTSFAIAAFSLTGSGLAWIGLWILYAIISIAVKPTIWTAAVTGVFSAGQGLAMGVTLSGMALTNVILPPLAVWLIDLYGWRGAYVALGFGWGAVTFLLSWFFLYDAHDRKSGKRSGISTPTSPRAEQASDFPGLTIPQAWRSRALWHIAVSTFLILAMTMGLGVHTIAILGDVGLGRSDAAYLASLGGIAAVAGKLATGVLLDRYSAKLVGGVTLALTAFGFGLLIESIQTTLLIAIAMVIGGYTQGAKWQICGYLTSRHAGMKNFGAIYGFMNSVIALGGGVGPLIAGLSYDLLGGYETFLIAGVIGSVISGILIITLPPLPDWDERREDEAMKPALA
ncbi:MAG TPA: MFS transporter [Novosphingobium sp.]|nr:MFS transporter [Novosphingobium sp.]